MRLRSPLMPAVLLSTAVLACSGSDDKDTTAPALQAAALGNPSTIRLTFSEPMVVGQANPAAFRLSLAVKDAQSTVYYALEYDGLGYGTDGPISDGDPSAASVSGSASGSDSGSATATATATAGSSTYDPTGYDPTGYDPTGYGSGYAIPGAPGDLRRPIPTRFISDLGITNVRGVDGMPNQLDLVLAASIADTPACDELPALVADSGKAGIFVHHKQGTGSPADQAGNALADVGAHWVDATSKAYVELQGDFPNLDPYLPIACP